MDRSPILYNSLQDIASRKYGKSSKDRTPDFLKPRNHYPSHGSGSAIDMRDGVVTREIKQNVTGLDFIPLGSSTPGDSGNRNRSNNWGKQYGRPSTGNNRNIGGYGSRGFSPYQCIPRQQRTFKYQKRGGFANHNREPDISLYYRHSMVEDPWAKLEEQAYSFQLNKSDSSSSEVSSNATQISILGGSSNSLSDSDEATSNSPIHSQEQDSGGSSSESLS